jgi:hypothetical protein
MNTHTSAQSKKLIELLEQKGVTPERFQIVLGSGILSDVFEEKATLGNRFAVRQALGLGPLPSESIVLIVDYGQTLEQMIATGRYDWKNDDITAKRFPIEGKGTVEFEAVLFHFDKDISSENAKEKIEEAGYEVGKIEHILSFGANYLEEQRKFPIVGLGSVGEVGGCRHVPCLGGHVCKRILSLYWWVDAWFAFYRFLGVRKKVSQTLVS